MKGRSAPPARAGRDPRASSLAREVSDLAPGSFALVMATGIISSAARLLSFPRLALGLLVLNVAFYVVLWLLTLARLAWYYPRLRADLVGQSTGPGFFTMVAGTCVLGTELVLVRQDYGLGLGLLVVGLLLWLVLTYAFFAAVMTASPKPAPGSGVHGGWMIAVVATQSISVLATVVSGGYPADAPGLLFLSLCFFLAGAMLYIVLITIVVSRLVFLALAPADLAPVSWVLMGAAAITTLRPVSSRAGASGGFSPGWSRS